MIILQVSLDRSGHGTLNTGLPLTSASAVCHRQRGQALNAMLKLHGCQSQEQKPGNGILIVSLGIIGQYYIIGP
jgi:hypothetical protein